MHNFIEGEASGNLQNLLGRLLKECLQGKFFAGLPSAVMVRPQFGVSLASGLQQVPAAAKQQSAGQSNAAYGAEPAPKRLVKKEDANFGLVRKAHVSHSLVFPWSQAHVHRGTT